MDLNFTIPATHPSLKGHFPGNPVVPGVVILDEVTSLVKSIKPGYTISALPSVKFVKPLLPEQAVKLEITEKSDTAISFSCHVNDEKIVIGQMTLKAQL